MATELVWLVLGGLLVGTLGRVALPAGPRPLHRLSPLLLGLGGAIGGGYAAKAVLGRGHETVQLLVAVVLAGLLVGGYSVYRRSRSLPPC